jgi:hypothetical protein
MPTKLILIKESREERFNKMLDSLVDGELDQFAINLVIAREVWRKHPALVECLKFPEPYRSRLRAENTSLEADVPHRDPASRPEELRKELEPRGRARSSPVDPDGQPEQRPLAHGAGSSGSGIIFPRGDGGASPMSSRAHFAFASIMP